MIKVMVFDNFNVAAFDDAAKQRPEVQTNLLLAWAEKAKSAGFSLDGIVVETEGGKKWRIFETARGFNLEQVGLERIEPKGMTLASLMQGEPFGPMLKREVQEPAG